MHCPHCQSRLRMPRPVTHPKRLKLFAHHGEVELDAEQLHAIFDMAKEYLVKQGEIARIRKGLGAYRRIMDRLEREPAFAEHVLAYDGDSGQGQLPQDSRAAELARLKARMAAGQASDDDVLRYMAHMVRL